MPIIVENFDTVDHSILFYRLGGLASGILLYTGSDLIYQTELFQ